MRSKQALIRLGKDGDTLRLTLTSQYLHLRLTSPGRFHYIEEMYIPRKQLMGVIRWLIKSAGQVPRERSAYPPDLVRRYLEAEDRIYEGQRRMKREAGQARRTKRRQRG